VARILLAWELGGDYGHLMRFLTISRELVRRGHEPVLALRELTFVDAVLGDEPYAVFQAPIWAARVTGLPAPINFAETLMRLGFMHPSALAGLCRGWRALVDAITPRLILFDYAPTALLATRGLSVPRVLFGAPFSIPPRTDPMPVYRWWKGESPSRVLGSERHVLVGANAVLARFSQPPLRRLGDLLDTDESILAGSKDFDQYPDRVDGRYWGDVANLDKGVPPPWPLVGSKRVFAYIKPHSRDFEEVLAALRTIDASVVVHAPGVSANVVRKYTAANVAFSEDPVRMADVCRECHVGICHAGSGTVQSLVVSGKPVLLLPEHLEQMMTAKRVQQLGAGLIVDFEKPSPDYGRLIRRLLDESSFTEAAQAVSRRLAGDNQTARVARIVDRLEELIASAVPV